ncbi:integrase [Pseudoalteromonas undina]|uniref:tyrosine-type recombinase/integrase n=1 Tax=Pseudoalteromonas undina TaxID=43660 RepID=UPI0006BA8627|nr:site-specific integrase [Pseudoalteromonas undina]KPH89755.1 integrase [Pseudoalteromonas undina]
MSDTKFRFTELSLEKIESNGKRTRYYDNLLSGLILDVSVAGKKSFRVYKKIPGRDTPINVTLGYFPSIALDDARRMARKVMADIAEGINPNDLKRQFRAASITLKEAFDSYIESRDLKPITKRGYKQKMDCYLPDWHNKRLADINQTMILKRQREITSRSPAQANYTMRLMRALFNFAKAEYKSSEGRSLFPENPVDVLSEKRSWNKVKRKTTRLRQSQLEPFLEALNKVRDEATLYRQNDRVAFCDYIEFVMFTGLRKMELLQLPWSQVFMEDKFYLLKDTKNGEDVEFPMTTKLIEIFERRKIYKVSPYVFGKATGKGWLVEPKKTLAKICELAKIEITLHDLRRTFASIAESNGISGYRLKRLLNHLTDQSDVTAGYTILTAEELREPMQYIVDKIEVYARFKDGNNRDDIEGIKYTLSKLSKEQRLEVLGSVIG